MISRYGVQDGRCEKKRNPRGRDGSTLHPKPSNPPLPSSDATNASGSETQREHLPIMSQETRRHPATFPVVFVVQPFFRRRAYIDMRT